MTSSAGRVAVVVAAAGNGERLGAGIPKALVAIGGVPMLIRAVEAMAAAGDVDLVVVAAPGADLDDVVALLQPVHGKLAAGGVMLSIVAGGATRQASVQRALDAIGDAADIVLVHDAARALAPTELADAVIAAVRAGSDAVVPGLPIADTVKSVDADEHVTGTPDRSALRAVQTPQGFRRATLAAAHAHAQPATGGFAATDDAGLVERLGGRVVVIPGSPDAFKITGPSDLAFAEVVLATRAAPGA
ncbi:MAG: 2-C-methyl-D-erythritol 4-phosphate cytidylyltransferase [Frankiales bacterium]|nr:2-C-methyl-D-erythritol 4-phosphate cytidylyltransferase [Frankiales bacterium]